MHSLLYLESYCDNLLLFVGDLGNSTFLLQDEEGKGEIGFDMFEEVGVAAEVVSSQ